jgi:hypothetical protein
LACSLLTSLYRSSTLLPFHKRGLVMKCSRCDLDSVIIQGHQHLCEKHYRFGQMRSSAKRHGKVVPTHEQLALMTDENMICPDCGIKMNWRSKDGMSSVASLQHYRSGRISIVCRSCNTRHASMEGDSYCDMPKDHKRCPSCLGIKPSSEFFLDNGRSGLLKRKSICKICACVKLNQWREKNKDEYNLYQRNYRA